MHPSDTDTSLSSPDRHDDLLFAGTASSTILSVTRTFIQTAVTSVALDANNTMGALSGAQDDHENNGECKLLGPFSVVVQAALGTLALLSLVYKRWRERPQRPIKIWAFDVSKQVFGSVLLHLANLFMSMFSAGEIQASIAKVAASSVGAEIADYQPNPCSFYLLNLGIDTTIGIAILVIILRVLTIGVSYTPIARPPESIQSGNYGDPPKATWWLKQSIIYFLGLLGMKTCVFFIFELCPWIVKVGDWALRWTEGNESVQIAFVMFIFPLIMNAVQYYIIDIFIKKKPTMEPDDGNAPSDGDDGEQGGLLADDSVDHEDAVDTDEAYKSPVRTKIKSKDGTSAASYDADEDDETGSANGESSITVTSHLDEDHARQKPLEI